MILKFNPSPVYDTPQLPGEMNQASLLDGREEMNTLPKTKNQYSCSKLKGKSLWRIKKAEMREGFQCISFGCSLCLCPCLCVCLSYVNAKATKVE